MNTAGKGRMTATSEKNGNQRVSVAKEIMFPSLWLSIALLTGCQNLGSPPRWVANPKTVYPEAQYLVAVGAGDTRRTAENAAAGNLSRIFEVHIESDERLLDQTRESATDFSRTTDFISDINIFSSQTLYNIQHAEAWKDKTGRYHAVAYLNRHETAALYRDKIAEQITRVEFLLASVERTDNLLQKYASLRSAAKHAATADRLMQQLNVIHSPSAATLTPTYSINELRTKLADTAQAIKVQISIEGDPDKHMHAALEQLITRYGFSIGQPALLTIGGRVSIMTTGEQAAGLVFVRYDLNLQIRDTDNNILIAVGTKGREAHQTLEQARIRAFRTLEKVIQPDAAHRLDTYFDSLIDRP